MFILYNYFIAHTIHNFSVSFRPKTILDRFRLLTSYIACIWPLVLAEIYIRKNFGDRGLGKTLVNDEGKKGNSHASIHSFIHSFVAAPTVILRLLRRLRWLFGTTTFLLFLPPIVFQWLFENVMARYHADTGRHGNINIITTTRPTKTLSKA
jgi:hypothetical protein